jgi:hypothetical protein
MQFIGCHLPGMPVRTQNCRGTDAAVDARSPTTGGTLDIAHWGQPSPQCAHTGRQTCAQSLATPVHIALGNPTKKWIKLSYMMERLRDV